MVKTALACPEEPTGSVRLAQDYLEEYDGSVGFFWERLNNDQRLGQAFFNSLSLADQAKIMGKLVDPFYQTGSNVIENAVEFLLYN